MSRWLEEGKAFKRLPTASDLRKTQRQLRALDLILAAPLALLLWIPYVLLQLVAPREPADCPANGDGKERRHALRLPDNLFGRLMGHMGAGSWPVVYDVLVGRMAWVGPTSLDSLPRAVVDQGLQPGVVTLWGLRRRTAVAYASEVECDHEYLVRRGLRHDLGLLLRACLLAPLPVHQAVFSDSDRVRVVDVAFDNLDMQEALDRLDSALEGQDSMQVSFVNPACVNIAAGDRAYRRALARAALILPDGIGIKMAADILGRPLKQNVNGTDLFPRLCALLERRQARLFLLGGQPGVPEAVAAQVRHRWPGVNIVGVAHGFFTTEQEGQMVARIRASGADAVLVARGVPAQDIFIDRYLPQFGAKVVMGVGGLFDFVAGRIDRAPQWMRDSGLEWAYRLLQEPGRMWRRYLVGNFTFLVRVALQRMGWRQPAVDDLPVGKGTVPAPAGSVRAVLFACESVDPSIPADQGVPAALLPLGCASFLERALEHLSEAGVRHVHLVVSHQPEALRRVVAMGERWGLKVQWHLAKDETRPYGVLSLIDWQGASRVVVGHAERWIGRQPVGELATRDAVAWLDDPGPNAWSGWSSHSPSELVRWPGAGTWGDVMSHLLTTPPDQFMVCAGARSARAGSAAELLAAQFAVAEPDPQQEPARQVPGAWIKTAWGGMSPSSRVHPRAVIRGPVLLGPGCLVDAEARIGPDVVLERDVVVTRGSAVSQTVVLPNTFIGEGLSVTGGVVGGNRLHQVDLGVTIELPASDGLLMDLNKGKLKSKPGWLARGAAAVACSVLWIPAVGDGWLRSARRLPPRCLREVVAVGEPDAFGQVRTQSLWVLSHPRPRSRLGHWLSLYRPLSDVVRGQRAWLGRRPLSVVQWEALSDDWRRILTGQAVGVVHAPAWSDRRNAHGLPEGWGDTRASCESEVAADVFLAVQQDQAWRRGMLLARLWSAETPQSSTSDDAPVVPPTWRPATDPEGRSGPPGPTGPEAGRDNLSERSARVVS